MATRSTARNLSDARNIGGQHAWKMEWVPLPTIQVNPEAQRDLNEAKADQIAKDLDLDGLGVITISRRDGVNWCLDGQHRVEGLRRYDDGSWADYNVECRVYENLTVQEEAELFLVLNNKVNVTTFEQYKVALAAGRPEVTNVHKVLTKVGLVESKYKGENHVACVGALLKVHADIGNAGLTRTLNILLSAYGIEGIDAPMVKGIGMFIKRYGRDFDEERLINRLSTTTGSIGGLRARVSVIRSSTRKPLADCTAAAALAIYNAGRGGSKLPPFWDE